MEKVAAIFLVIWFLMLGFLITKGNEARRASQRFQANVICKQFGYSDWHNFSANSYGIISLTCEK